MIYGIDDLLHGFGAQCDAVVVGSGAGGAVAAANLARAGMRVVVLESGPQVKPADMTRDAPRFLARYYWEGGLRMVGGTTTSPSMQARCLGGGTVVNSAIMLRLPDWVRALWRDETGMDLFHSPAFDAAYDGVFRRLGVTPTPMAVMGRRNLVVRDALDAAGIPNGPLPRAVVDCHGCGDCLTGCAGGHKQSVDRAYLPSAQSDGAEIFTCAHVDRILVRAGRADGVEGRVIHPRTHQTVARFRVRAPLVVLAAGAVHTPVLLQRSRIDNGTAGRTFFAHIGGGLVAFMDEVVDPWVGATQGWGAMSEEIRGLKYESLWAPPAVLFVRWGDIGKRFFARLDDARRAVVVALVYRANVRGDVRARRNGTPSVRLWIPDSEAIPVLKGLKIGVEALLEVGARSVETGVPYAVPEMRRREDADSLRDPRIRARHLRMTMNHIFGSCRMGRNPDEHTVDENGKVRGIDGVYVCDASLFPSPSGVNPQATIMALSDIVSRRLAGVAMPN